MFEFILYMAFQELEWHAVDEVTSMMQKLIFYKLESGEWNPCLRSYRTILEKQLTTFAF